MRTFFVCFVMVALIASCTTIPQQGPVMSSDFSPRVTSDGVDVLPPGPSAGATQDDILAGFMAAGAAAQDNYRVARSYLSAEAQGSWNPNAVAYIRAGEPEVTLGGANIASYVLSVGASVDEFGRYFDSPEAPAQSFEFQFVLEEGEWRISALSDGVVLSQAAFREAFINQTRVQTCQS